MDRKLYEIRQWVLIDAYLGMIVEFFLYYPCFTLIKKKSMIITNELLLSTEVESFMILQ